MHSQRWRRTRRTWQWIRSFAVVQQQESDLDTYVRSMRIQVVVYVEQKKFEISYSETSENKMIMNGEMRPCCCYSCVCYSFVGDDATLLFLHTEDVHHWLRYRKDELREVSGVNGGRFNSPSSWWITGPILESQRWQDSERSTIPSTRSADWLANQSAPRREGIHSWQSTVTFVSQELGHWLLA